MTIIGSSSIIATPFAFDTFVWSVTVINREIDVRILANVLSLLCQPSGQEE